MLEFVTEKKSVWEYIRECEKPIALYGMGDGAEKIIRAMQRVGRKPDAVFASDGFARHNNFCGYTVKSLFETEAELGDFLILLSFATERQDVLELIYSVAERHELLAPDVPVIDGTEIFDLDFLYKNAENIQKVYDLLQDEQSKKVFADCINYKISGKIEYLRHCETQKSEMYLTLIKPCENETYVDLGAYNGDTVREFLSFTDGKYKSIHALEPDRKNFMKLTKSCEGLENVFLHNKGAHSKKDTLFFDGRAGRNSALSQKGTISVEVDSVDNLCFDFAPTIIKFDVEGAEKEALVGCEKTIKAHKPRLMVSAYHKSEDIFELPLLIKKLCPEYKIYLRHHPYVPCWETNCYAL